MKVILKFVFILLLAFSIPYGLYAKKTIYITLDISGSMAGQKYDLANYGAQVLSVLNNEDNVILIVNSKVQNISDNGYSAIQKGMNLFGAALRTEIEDIRKFNSEFSGEVKNQEIFIIGDGCWRGDKEIWKEFLEKINTGNLRVTFMEVLEAPCDPGFYKTSFGDFLRENRAGKVIRVSSSSEIINAVNTIAEEITGVSTVPDKELTLTGNCILFSTELTVNNIKFIYQDASSLKTIPQITSIKVDGKEVRFKKVGNPSNETFLSSKEGRISSRVFELQHLVPAGAKVEICFSGNIQKEKLRIYPIADVEFSGLNMSTLENQPVQQIDENTFKICSREKSVEVSFQFTQNGQVLTGKLIESATVNFISNGTKYKAQYKNGQFFARIPLKGTEAQYTVESELKGYFRKNSGVKKIIIADDCDVVPEVIELPRIFFGSVSLDQLIREGKVSGRMYDEITGKSLDPNLFDIEVGNNYKHIFKSIRLEFREDTIIDLIVEPRGYWCDCFMPDLLDIDFFATPKQGQLIDGKQYNGFKTVLQVQIIKNQSWLNRCKWLLLTMLFSVGAFWYLLLLVKKKRFGKGAKIVFKFPKPTSRSMRPEYNQTDFILRKKGLLAWINRWLIPFGTEKNALSFNSIGVSLQFTATSTIKQILFPKSGFVEGRMKSDNYDPDSKGEFIVLDESCPLEITHTGANLIRSNNFLEYYYPKFGNDIQTYGTVLRFLMFCLAVYFFTALILIIYSIF